MEEYKEKTLHLGGYEEECQAITGAVIDGDYRDYSNGGGFFTIDGCIIDGGNQHPYFELEPNELIRLELGGFLDIERTVEEYIMYLSGSNPEFSNTFYLQG